MGATMDPSRILEIYFKSATDIANFDRLVYVTERGVCIFQGPLPKTKND